MFGYRMSVVLFTAGALLVWGLALSWAYRQPKYRWYYVWMLGLVTTFWWLGESIAIRLGKYKYEAFPFLLSLPFGGAPGATTSLDRWLLSLLPDPDRLPSKLDSTCAALNWQIPFPVVALEGALLFGFFVLALRVVRSEKGARVRAAAATGGLCGVLMVNAFGVLDPVVSATRWCEPGVANPNGHYLHVGLWTWFTTDTHPGYWYGVPLVNYAAWFLAAAAFAFVARLDDERPSGLIRKHLTLLNYAIATIVVLGLFFGTLIPFKSLIDRIMIDGQARLFSPHPVFSARVWQFGAVAGLLAAGVLAFYRGARRQAWEVPWRLMAPKLVTFGFCAGALLWEPHRGLWRIWALTALISATVLLWPQIVVAWRHLQLWWHHLLNRLFGEHSQPAAGEATVSRDINLGV